MKTKMQLSPARINYTTVVDYMDLPEDIRDVLYNAAVNEDLGTLYDYVDGDFHVTPTWKDSDMVALTDAELTALQEGEPAEGQTDAAFDALESRLENEFGIDGLQTHIAIEVARRHILSSLSGAERAEAISAMDADHLAISFYQ